MSIATQRHVMLDHLLQGALAFLQSSRTSRGGVARFPRCSQISLQPGSPIRRPLQSILKAYMLLHSQTRHRRAVALRLSSRAPDAGAHLQPLLRALGGLLRGRQLAQRRAVLHLQLAQLLPSLPLGALSRILQARPGCMLPATACSASGYALATSPAATERKRAYSERSASWSGQ